MKSFTIMIRAILLFAFTLISILNTGLFGQNITLKTHTAVNSFNSSTTIINGDLQIGYNEGLNTATNISDLSNLEKSW